MAKFINPKKLPDYICNAVESTTHKPNPDRMGVTELIGPPLIKTLTIKHWDELVYDVSDFLWRLDGIAFDKYIKEFVKDGLTNLKFEMPMELMLVGKPDLYYPQTETLIDFKRTSVWSLKELKDDWLKQINVYAFMLDFNKYPVKKAEIHGFAKDWRQNEKLRYGHDYLDIPFKIMDVPLWNLEDTGRYIDCQMKEHIENPLRECTDEEKWKSKDTWAVKKKGNKTARGGKLCYSKEEAEKFILANPNKTWEIEFRKGECVRCQKYCSVNSVCKFFKG